MQLGRQAVWYRTYTRQCDNEYVCNKNTITHSVLSLRQSVTWMGRAHSHIQALQDVTTYLALYTATSESPIRKTLQTTTSQKKVPATSRARNPQMKGDLRRQKKKRQNCSHSLELKSNTLLFSAAPTLPGNGR